MEKIFSEYIERLSNETGEPWEIAEVHKTGL
jgi:hypothetical protein